MATKGRTTVYNNITSDEKLKRVNPENLQLGVDFLEYLRSVDRADSTIKQYSANLKVFWCWNLDYNNNKKFINFTKREFAKFQFHAMNVWQWSPKRVRTVKATISSLSNFISDILDDEFKDYRPVIRKIESPADEPVREKTVFTNDDIQPLLDYLIENKQYEKACFVALALYSGRRKSELAAFKISYFDNDNLICDGALYKTPEKVRTKGRGSRGKMLELYILAKPFKPYLDHWIKERKKLNIKSIWLFPSCSTNENEENDKHIGTSIIDNWSEQFSGILNKPFYPHALRHTFTTSLLEQNLPESIVQTILGWSSSDMLRIYDDRTADSQLEKYFGADGIKNVEQKSLSDL